MIIQAEITVIINVSSMNRLKKLFSADLFFDKMSASTPVDGRRKETIFLLVLKCRTCKASPFSPISMMKNLRSVCYFVLSPLTPWLLN